jgi:hypothetical protein
VADALDHRSVVPGIGEDDDAGDLRTERAERRPVGDIAGGEEKGRFLVVQVRKFALQQHMVMIRAGDVAGTAGAGATLVDRELHRFGDLRMLAHAEIVVRAPYGDFLRTRSGMAYRPGKTPATAFQIGEDTVTAFLAHCFQFVFEESLEIHCCLQTGTTQSVPASAIVRHCATRQMGELQPRRLRQKGADL